MKVVAQYSFNNGVRAVAKRYAGLLREVKQAVAAVDADACKTKTSKEKTIPGQMLFDPKALNAAFKREFLSRDWHERRVKCEYSTEHYVAGYKPKPLSKGAFREMDFIKEKLGVEVQFGKYAFMVCNVCAKMTIFHRLGYIDTGIEIVPVKKFADEMSSGVSYFEQFVWDLEHRGVADIDIPVLILGVDR